MWRNNYGQFQAIFSKVPVGDNDAVGAAIRGADPGNATARMWGDRNTSITRLCGVDARDVAIEPIAHGTVSIVIERGGVECAVGANAVPFLPDCGCVFGERV